MRIEKWLNRILPVSAPDLTKPSDPARWVSPYETLREKWVEVPTTRAGRQRTTELADLSDEKLMEIWEGNRTDITTGSQFYHRGWYHTLYKDFMRGKKVLDVGSGLAVDSITFAQNGADLTFVDLAQSNLNVLRRVCNHFGLTKVKFVQLVDLKSLDVLEEYDVIMAMGSLHHAPQSVIKPEVDILLKHLKIGGRWLQLAYPETRWIREGSRPFDQWGGSTDGENTPWVEWYDLPKLLKLLHPAKFQTVLYQEFHNNDFNWFDLLFEGFEK